MNCLLNREEFTKVIASYKELQDFTHELNGIFDKFKCDGHLLTPVAADAIIDLLRFIFDDQDDWISYWVCELNFGEEYEDGYVKDKDGKHIPLKTSDDLYALLVDNYRSNHPDAEV